MRNNSIGGKKNIITVSRASFLDMYVTRVPQGPRDLLVWFQPDRLRFLFILKRRLKVLLYSAVVMNGTEQTKVVLSNVTRAISFRNDFV